MAVLDLVGTMRAMSDCLVAAGVVKVAHPHPVRGVDVGEAVPGVPGDFELGMTFGRGTDRCVIPLIIVAGLEHEPETWQRISDLIGAGGDSVCAALEPDLGGAVGSAVVLSPPEVIRVLTAGDITHMAVRFGVEVLA